MVVDTSALLAVLFAEPDSELFTARLLAESQPKISTGSLLETALVVEVRKGAAGVRELDALIARLNVLAVPVDGEQLVAAREGFRQFGKGRHPAGLNFGDCFAYGLAIALGEPLLFKGDGFSKTDVRNALLQIL